MSNYISVAELSSIELSEQQIMNDVRAGDGPKIMWEMDLPSDVDSERIEVNVGGWHRLQKIGAICTSAVLGYEGGTTIYTPVDSGIDSDGSTTNSKKRSLLGLEDLMLSLLLIYRFPSLSRTALATQLLLIISIAQN